MSTGAIVGTGLDLVEVDRIRRAVASARFVDRIFTPEEAAYCRARGPQAAASFAARFAAKEAAMKALGTGWGGGRWRDIQVVRNADGHPSLEFAGMYAAAAQRLGVTGIWLSLSHERTIAAAHVVLWRG